MNAVPIAKAVVKFVAAAGIGAVIENAVKMNTPEGLNVVNKTLVWVGTAVISGFVAAKGSDYLIQQIDEVGSSLKLIKVVPKVG